VANYAAGRGESERAIPMERIAAVLDEAMDRVRRIIEELCA
jgi:5'-methylthioadenosine phosphorylase